MPESLPNICLFQQHHALNISIYTLIKVFCSVYTHKSLVLCGNSMCTVHTDTNKVQLSGGCCAAPSPMNELLWWLCTNYIYVDIILH